MRKGVVKNIFKWGSLGAYIICVLTILIESGIDGKNSADQSNSVTDQIQDAIDKNHDNKTVKEINNFNISFNNPNSNNTYFVGDNLTYTIDYTPSDTSFKELTWSILDPSILKVSEATNTLSFEKKGYTKLTVTSNRKPSLVQEFEFYVKNIPVESIEITSKPTYPLNIGDSFDILANVLPNNATNKNLTYHSSDNSVVAISNSTLFAKGPGKATILVSSEDSPSINESFEVEVNKPIETKYYIKSINVKNNNTILNERNKSLNVTGTYTDASADFDINKLNISILDSNDYIKISQKKLTSKGNFSFLVSLNNSKLEEIKTLNNYKIPLSVHYEELDESFKKTTYITVSKLLLLHKSDVGNVNTNTKELKYTHFMSYGNEVSLYKDVLKINIPFKVNTTNYNINNYKWEIYTSSNSSYEVNTYFKMSSSYNSISLTPISKDLPPKGYIRYIPNKNIVDEFIDFSFNYSNYKDENSKITDFNFTKFKENSTTNFFIEDINSNNYKNILSTSISVSSSTPSNIKSSLTNSQLIMDLIDNDGVASFLDDEIGNHIGLKFNKVGTATLTLKSVLATDLPIKKYYLVANNTPNKASLLANGVEVTSNNLSLGKDQKIVFDSKASFVTKFGDNSTVTIPLYSDISWSYDKKYENNIIFVDSTHTIQGLKQDNSEDKAIIDFTLKYNNVDITDLLIIDSVNVVVTYIPIDSKVFNFSYETISTINEYNSINKEYTKVPLYTQFYIRPIFNNNATNKIVSYKSSDDKILTIDPETGLATANKVGEITITVTSLDDESISISKSMTIIDTVSPFILDTNKFKPLSIKEIHKDDNTTIDYYDVSLEYGISYQIYIKPLKESTSTTLTFKHLDTNKENKKHSVTIDKSGRITTNDIGKDIIEIIYGDTIGNNTYSQIIHFNVTRNHRFTFHELSLIVRKSLGHFGLFACTALVGLLFICLAFKDNLTRIYASLVSMVLGFSLAGFSELIQKYTPGRACTWTDIGIDTLGYAFTVVISLIVIASIILFKYIKKYKKDKKEIKNKE